MATMVFSKAGAAELFAILSISARFSVIATSSAGLKRATCTLSNGGTPPYGPSQLAKSGFGSTLVLAWVFMPFGLLIRLATVETIKAAAKSSSRLRVIKSRIRFIVLCIDIHDALRRRRDGNRAVSIFAGTN